MVNWERQRVKFYVQPFVRKTLSACAESVPPSLLQSEVLALAGRPWAITKSVYQVLAQESKYAAWVAAFGFRPNHFTVSVNALRNFADLRQVNALLEANGHVVNSSGGKIKGSAAVYLEQSSTMAEEISVEFEDGRLRIPGCYYEFPKRYKLANGNIYHGFVTASANRIFASTFSRAA